MQQLPRRSVVVPFVEVPAVLPDASVVCAGWLLKKRRKKMQGFARRFFTLHQSGLLCYSFQPGQEVRDQIQLQQAAISTAPGRRDIHLDSNNATFHIKCLTEHDFNMWMAAFRKFLARDSQTLGRRSSVLKTLPRAAQYGRTTALAEDMGNTISELENAFLAWVEDDNRKKYAQTVQMKPEKDHSGRNKLGLFKKAHHHHESTQSSSQDSRLSDASAASSSSYLKIQSTLDSLRQQHTALVKSLIVVPSIDIGTMPSRNATLSSTAEEDGAQTPTSYRKSHRMSGISSNSDSSVWYDAPEGEGAEEFVLDPTPLEETQELKAMGMDNRSVDLQNSTPSSTEVYTDSESEEDAEFGEPDSAPNSADDIQVVRRTELPSGPVGDEGSLFAVLKKNVGKDLSQVALPVTFNEPLTLLQKIAEQFEYYDILTQAVQASNPVDRLCHIAAFAVSTYANTKYRTGRKGFNPMLAETFEDVRMKFISEKVSHNPVILAYHAEGEGWELYGTSSGKTKFWGKSLEIIPQGITRLRIGDEHYQWNLPSSFMRNLMMGTKYLEHCGKMIIENTSKGGRCILEFKEGGYWGPANVVAGMVQTSSGETAAQLEGKWDEQIVQKLDSSHLHVLWRITPFPKNAPECYGFTSFGITLNEITPDLKGHLPPTDSRLRTDMRALEEGNVPLAESEKVRVEELQRERRRAGAERGPRWFKRDGEEWTYIGGYWEQRARGQWEDVRPLW